LLPLRPALPVCNQQGVGSTLPEMIVAKGSSEVAATDARQQLTFEVRPADHF